MKREKKVKQWQKVEKKTVKKDKDRGERETNKKWQREERSNTRPFVLENRFCEALQEGGADDDQQTQTGNGWNEKGKKTELRGMKNTKESKTWKTIMVRLKKEKIKLFFPKNEKIKESEMRS